MTNRDAVSAARDLLEALSSALRSAESETEALRRWQQAEVLASTVQREAFAAEAGELSTRLKAALAREPTRSPELQGLLQDLKARAAKLAARDSINRELANRVLSFTKAYFNAILPKPQAYDRRGQATVSVAPPSTISQRL